VRGIDRVGGGQMEREKKPKRIRGCCAANYKHKLCVSEHQ